MPQLQTNHFVAKEKRLAVRALELHEVIEVCGHTHIHIDEMFGCTQAVCTYIYIYTQLTVEACTHTYKERISKKKDKSQCMHARAHAS